MDKIDFPQNSSEQRYQNLEFIGEGGMGRVYRAKDTRLNRTVALKFLQQEDAEQLNRFLNEARTQAQVDHPAVGRIYEVGEYDSHPYISMQYIDGKPLHEVAARMTLAQKVTIMAEVSEAIGAAHRVGLIHRDIKPANILVEFSEDGVFHPFVVDFGLAREVDTQGPTVSGTILGSPAYMAPEQARGDVHQLDRRTDVYSLGASFYHLLTGVAPFKGDNPVHIILNVLGKEPPTLRQINAEIPADLETIILKCMEKDPARRYLSTGALREDIRRYQDGEPILARRASLSYRIGKLVRKNRLAFGILTTALCAILILLAFWLHTLLRANQRAEMAQRFGQAVKDIEYVMEYDRLLPLHNAGAAKARVKQQIVALEKQIAALGKLAKGPGHFALGRAYLSLNETDIAHRYLTDAWQGGYETADTAYALGWTKVNLYQQALLAADRIRNPELAKSRRLEIETQFREPALQLLARAQDVSGESPHYLKALLAYLEKKYAACLSELGLVLDKNPWHHRALKLRGDVLMAQARMTWEAGDYPKARSQDAGALQAITAALDISRSDGLLYNSAAKFWTYCMQKDMDEGKDPSAALKDALQMCGKALQVDSELAEADQLKATALGFWSEYQMRHGQDPRPTLDEALQVAEHLVKIRPQVAESWLSRGFVLWRKGQALLNMGQNPIATLQAAVESFDRSRALNPENTALYNDQGISYALQGVWQSQHGEDPRPILAKAVAAYERALQRDPRLPSTLLNLGTACQIQAEYTREHGGDYRPQLVQGAAALEKAVQLAPGNFLILKNLGSVYEMVGEYELDHGLDPSAQFEKAVNYLQRSLERNPANFSTLLILGITLSKQGELLASRGKDPSVALRQAEDVYNRAQKLNPTDAVALNNVGNTLAIQGAWLVQHGQNPAAVVSRAAATMQKALRMNANDPFMQNTLANLHILTAEYGLYAGLNVKAPLQLAEQALAGSLRVDPNYGYAYVSMCMAQRLQVEAAMRRGQPYAALLKACRANAEQAVKLNADSYWGYLERARCLLLHARAQGMSNQAMALSHVQAAQQDLVRIDQINANLLEAFQLRAEACALAVRLGAQAEEATQQINQGLAYAVKAMQINPHFARTLLLQAILFYEQSQRMSDPAVAARSLQFAQQAWQDMKAVNLLLVNEASALGWPNLTRLLEQASSK